MTNDEGMTESESLHQRRRCFPVFVVRAL